MQTLKGWMSEPKTYRGVPNVSHLFFRCPNKTLKPHNDCIPVTEGDSCIIGSSHIWHYEMRDGKCWVTPSIDASQTPCQYHDYFNFELVSEKEIEGN